MRSDDGPTRGDLEHQVVALQAALARERQNAAALRDADAAKDALLLAVSHDLNTPVAAVAGLAEVLAEHSDLPEGEIRRIARGLATIATQLRSILANLLDLERIMGGHVVAQRRSTDLTALVAASAAALCPADRTVLLPEQTVLADVDPVLTTHIVENLLGNALRYTPSRTAVHVDLRRIGTDVLLVIEDEGPGVPDETKETIFQAFQHPPAAAGGGLGLGLFIVRRFAELQGGRAWVDDAKGGGASFRVLLGNATHRGDRG